MVSISTNYLIYNYNSEVVVLDNLINYTLIRHKLKENDVNLKAMCQLHNISYFTVTRAIYEERNTNIKTLLFFADVCGVEVQDLIIRRSENK